jgi:hypothetical protein
MGGKVNISAQFPKDDRHLNGLERILAELIDDGMTEHVIVARVRRKRLNVDDDAGTATPSVKLVHVEAVKDPGRRDAVLEVLDQEYKDRTGRSDLPPHDMFNPGPGEHAGQTTVGQQLADRDPEAGPWPGDKDYQPPPTA